ncbi:MAG: wax ester/triacylglycerol synthase family O-acyltransferase [Thermoanaerobaculales bacterium]
MTLFEGEPLSNVDAAWLHMETPTNLMQIAGVMSFDEKLEFSALKEVIEDRLLSYERFRQRVEESALPMVGPRWVDDTHFNLRSHLQRVALPDPGGQHELQEMVSSLMSTPLDNSKPLWQFQYIENYRGGSAVVARIHHCIADGVALIRVLLGLTDDSPTGSPKTRPTRRRRQPLGGGLWLPEVVNDALSSARKLTGRLLEEGLEAVLDPARTGEILSEGAKGAGVLANLAAMPSDPDTLFKGALGTAKRCAWSEVLPLEQVKAFSKREGATINDVLLAGVAGALRRYMIGRKAEVDGVDFRAVVPVNLRPESDTITLGNKFGMVFLQLPIGVADRRGRLRELKRRMDAIKTSSEPLVIFGLLGVVGMAGPEVESLALQFFGSKATAVMTNVPGPRQEIYFAGKAMRSMMFWVPQAAKLGLGVSILSYAGQVRLGVVADAGLVPDPEAIIEAFEEEMRAMMTDTESAC